MKVRRRIEWVENTVVDSVTSPIISLWLELDESLKSNLESAYHVICNHVYHEVHSTSVQGFGECQKVSSGAIVRVDIVSRIFGQYDCSLGTR